MGAGLESLDSLIEPAVVAAALVLGLLAAARRARGREASRRRRLRLALLVGSCALSYCALEALVIFGLDLSDAHTTSLLSQRWFRRHAGAPNRLGFRDREHPPGDVPVAVLGDSFVWGFGLAAREVRVSERLEAHLRAGGTSPDRARVANWSVPGWGTRDELQALDEVLERQRPAVLVHVYVWNDAPGRPRPPVYPTPPPGLRFAVERSFAADLLWHRSLGLWSSSVREFGASVPARYEDPELMVEHARDLDALRARAARVGARYLAVGWPFHTAEFEAEYAAGRRWVRDYMASRGAEYLDLGPAFAGIRPRSLWAGPFDHHPDARAHDLAAQAIARRLLEAGD